jgi:hypothetical protein
MKMISVRFDPATLSVPEALMDDADRTSQGEMIRLLVKRAYRALLTHAQHASRNTSQETGGTHET